MPASETKAYCNARKRLPVRLLTRIIGYVAGRLCAGATPIGQGRILVDGTTVSMPDTALNQAKYPQHEQKKGCGFPIMKFVGLFCLNSGAWIVTAKSHFNVHESRFFTRLLRHLRKGDTLITDRGFCSYWAAATLTAMGVDFVMRNHQRRKADFRRGKRLWNKRSLHYLAPAKAVSVVRTFLHLRIRL
ncbi:MAG: transposase [Verrucomicrobiales bacterium]